MSSPWKNNYARYRNLFINTISQYQKKKDIKVYTELILSLTTIVVFSVFALRPTLLTIAKLIKEVESKEETLNTLSNKLNNLNVARSTYEKEQDNIKLLDISVPKHPNVDSHIRQVEGLVENKPIQVNSFSVGGVTILNSDDNLQNKQPSESKKINTMTFSLNVTSNYETITNLILSLENLRRPVTIESFSIERNQKDENKTLTLVTKGNVPYYKK